MQQTRLWLWCLSCVLACPGCGARQGRPASMLPEPPLRVAVLPPQWATLDPTFTVDAFAPLAQALEGAGTLEALDGGESEPCDEAPCFRAAGEQLGAGWVVVPRLAQLGDTVLLRLWSSDVARGTREQTHQETIQNATPIRVQEALLRLGTEIQQSLAPAPVAEVERSWYQRWWVWTILGGTLAAGAAATAVVLTAEDDGPEPDVTIVPP